MDVNEILGLPLKDDSRGMIVDELQGVITTTSSG